MQQELHDAHRCVSFNGIPSFGKIVEEFLQMRELHRGRRKALHRGKSAEGILHDTI